jgi:hypothetical protein
MGIQNLLEFELEFLILHSLNLILLQFLDSFLESIFLFLLGGEFLPQGLINLGQLFNLNDAMLTFSLCFFNLTKQLCSKSIDSLLLMR